MAAMGARIIMTSAARPPPPRPVAIAASVAAENHSPAANVREIRDRAGKSRGDRADQNVAVADVAEFVGQHAFQFFVSQQIENALGHGNRSMLRIASGGKGIGRVGWNHVHLRHGQADLLSQALDGVVGARQLLARDRLRAIHGQRDLVGEEIRNEIHDRGEGQRQQHSVLSTEGAAHEHQQQRQRGQQKRGLECVSHNFGGTI